MRILFLTLGYPPTELHGSATYTRNMARALAERGHDVHVLQCIPGAKPKDELDGAVKLHTRRPLRIRGFRRALRWASDSAFTAVESR